MTRVRALFLLFLASFQVLFVAASVVANRTRPQGLIASDGKSYYAWLRSLALDRDLDFRNDFRLIYPPDPLPDTLLRTPRGLVINKYPVGVALIEVPGFVVGHAIAVAFGLPANGVSAPYEFAVTLWLQLVCLAGLALLWLALVRLGATPIIAALGVASALTATNLIQYVARPAMSHGPGLAVLCAAFYVAVMVRDDPRHLSRIGIVGVLLGLAAIIRPSNVALAPFFAVFLLNPLGRSVPRWAALLAGFASMLAIQVVLMSLLWGELRFSGYVNEGFTSGLSGIFGTLFSARHGLFIYHPWYLVLVVVSILAAAHRDTRALGVGALASFATLTVINGTWSSWWFGAGFGNRAFIEVIPALVVTAVLWLGTLPPVRQSRAALVGASVMLVLSLSNAMLWTGFVLRRYSPDGEHSVSEAWLWPLR